MDTSLDHSHEHSHGLAPEVKVARARIGVLMLIISDLLSVLAIFAAGGYLSTLNTEGNFKVAGDFAPAFVPDLIFIVITLLSGALYFWWERSLRRSNTNGPTFVFVLSWICVLAAGVGFTWIGAALRYGIPISAYESILLLITWFTAIHLLLTAFVGLLIFGRILRGRLRIDGLAFVPEVAGYWWYYTVISALLMWVFGVFFK